MGLTGVIACGSREMLCYFALSITIMVILKKWKNMSNNADNSKIVFWAATLLSITTGLLAILLVPIDTAPGRFSFGISLIASLYHFIAAYYFISGIKHFKTGLRRSYVLLSFGMVVLGIAQAQLSFIDLFDWQQWILKGYVSYPYLVAIVFIFAAVRMFARLLKLKSVWMSWVVVILTSIAAAYLSTKLPHITKPVPERIIDGALIVTAVNAVFFIFAAAVVLRIKKSTGALYTNAMAWFYIAMLAAVVGAVHYIGVILLFNLNDWYYTYSISVLLFICSGWLFMRAGYSFSQIGRLGGATVGANEGSFFGNYTAPSTATHTSVVDAVLYASSLVSSPQDVDVILDQMRTITARLEPGEKPSGHDEARLLDVYLKLEHYLLNDDKLQNITENRLRAAVLQQTGVDIDNLAGATTAQ